MSFDKIWNTNEEDAWNRLLQRYWTIVRPENVQVEIRLNQLRKEDLSELNPIEWFSFLHDQYFVWKYTAQNRLATTRANLVKYQALNQLDELDAVREQILQLDETDIERGLKMASQIRGLGIAGASGLLSLIYPKYFATVDQFIVKALQAVREEASAVQSMNPEGLTVADGVVLTEILLKKSRSINHTFQTDFWTPRTLDMALWAYRGT